MPEQACKTHPRITNYGQNDSAWVRTLYSVNGKLFWVWTILNPQNGETYFAVRNNRGSDVLKELLPGWNGTVICDGWPPYGIFKKMQRCWAHPIREARHMSEKNPDDKYARRVPESLRDMHDDGKKKRPARDRQKAHDLLALRINRMISRHIDNPLLGKFMIKLQNALSHMFPQRTMRQSAACVRLWCTEIYAAA